MYLTKEQQETLKKIIIDHFLIAYIPRARDFEYHFSHAQQIIAEARNYVLVYEHKQGEGLSQHPPHFALVHQQLDNLSKAYAAEECTLREQIKLECKESYRRRKLDGSNDHHNALMSQLSDFNTVVSNTSVRLINYMKEKDEDKSSFFHKKK